MSSNRIAPPSAKLFAPPLPDGGRLGGIADFLGSAEPSGCSAAPKYHTVGDYYQAQADSQRKTVARVFEGIAELAPPVLLGQMAAIGIGHEFKADQRVFDLPWDPAGKWRVQAEKIHAQENQAAGNEIVSLPVISAATSAWQILAAGAGSTATVVYNGTAAAATAVYDGVVTVGNAAAHAIDSAGQAVAEAYKSLGRGLLGAVAYSGQGMTDWANAHKKDFQ